MAYMTILQATLQNTDGKKCDRKGGPGVRGPEASSIYTINYPLFLYCPLIRQNKA